MNKMILSLCVAGVLTGCGQQSAPSNVLLEATAAPEKADITSQTVSTDSIGKPTLPITIDYAYAQSPKVGEPLIVQVRVASEGIAAMSMRVSTRGDIALSKSTPAAIPMKSSGIEPASESHDIVVTPSAEGRSYLTVLVSGTQDGQSVTKAVSIPVQIGQGGPQLKTNGTIIATDVEVLSSMPARQSTSSIDDAIE